MRKQGRQNRKAHSLGPIKRDVPETFFRLCHHCLFLNESESEIQRCIQCEKDFVSSDKDQWESDPKKGNSELLETELDRQMEDEENSDERKEKSPPPQKKYYLNGLNGKW